MKINSSSDDWLRRDLVYWILQYLKDENLTEVAHVYERATGCYFDLKHFEVMVLQGRFEEAEGYLAGFTHIHDNMISTRIYFELRKQKFLEALDRKDRAKALDILIKDLNDFSFYNQNLYTDATKLLVMDNFRDHGALCQYGEVKTERMHMMSVVKKLIKENPSFIGKLEILGPKDPNLFRIVKRGLAEFTTFPNRPAGPNAPPKSN